MLLECLWCCDCTTKSARCQLQAPRALAQPIQDMKAQINHEAAAVCTLHRHMMSACLRSFSSNKEVLHLHDSQIEICSPAPVWRAQSLRVLTHVEPISNASVQQLKTDTLGAYGKAVKAGSWFQELRMQQIDLLVDMHTCPQVSRKGCNCCC